MNTTRDSLHHLWQNPSELQRYVAETILRPCEAHALHREIPAGTSLDFDTSRVWWIVQGAAQLESEHRPVVWLTHGDIVGPWQLGSSVLALATSQNESCELLGFAPDDIWGVLQHDPSKSWAWAAYQSTLCSRLFAEFVELKASSVAPQPHFKRFQRGETIILEGDEGDDVFVLAQGLAKVTRRGTHIGEIYQDEIFGALAALTDSVRTATVVASEPCDCMVFRKEEFRDLLRANPELMDKLFYDFGRALHDLNDSVQKAHHNKWRNLF